MSSVMPKSIFQKYESTLYNSLPPQNLIQEIVIIQEKLYMKIFMWFMVLVFCFAF